MLSLKYGSNLQGYPAEALDGPVLSSNLVPIDKLNKVAEVVEVSSSFCIRLILV